MTLSYKIIKITIKYHDNILPILFLLTTSKSSARSTFYRYFWSRVSTEFNIVGISIRIPIEINFDLRRNYWPNLSQVIRFFLLWMNRNSTKFYPNSVAILMFRFPEIPKSKLKQKSKFRFRHRKWNLGKSKHQN
jgi:hypothetical protein